MDFKALFVKVEGEGESIILNIYFFHFRVSTDKPSVCLETVIGKKEIKNHQTEYFYRPTELDIIVINAKIHGLIKGGKLIGSIILNDTFQTELQAFVRTAMYII